MWVRIPTLSYTAEFQSLGRAQCLCHGVLFYDPGHIFDSFNRSVALNASATLINRVARGVVV